MKNTIRLALLCTLGLAAPMTYAAEAVANVAPFAAATESVEDAVTQSSAFVIGQHYGGGIIFWIDGSGQHGLIAAESDQGSQLVG